MKTIEDYKLPSIEDILYNLETKYKTRNQELAWKTEKDNWVEILNNIHIKDGGIGFNYQIESVLGLGGAGVVFRIIDRNLFSDIKEIKDSSIKEKLRRSYRALKIPRPSRPP